MTNIRAYYASFFDDNLIAYVCLRLSAFMNCRDFRSDAMGLSSDVSVDVFRSWVSPEEGDKGDSHGRLRVYRDAIPAGKAWALARRLFGLPSLQAFAERRYLSSLRKGDIAYLWPGASLGLYKDLKNAGFTVVSERINTLLQNSKSLLDSEFISLGLTPGHGLSQEAVEEELACMELSDFIFSPSPAVTASIREAGIPEDRILQASYGLESREIMPEAGNGRTERPVTAIFVGTVCIRKGIHLLLDAWEKAGIGDARLVVVGRVLPEARPFLEGALTRHTGISRMDFVDDLGPVYRDADFLILPSIEEGSPLVTYLAFGAGLPVVVSPMGAGGVVEDGKEGFVVDPHDAEALAGAIRKLATDEALRKRMATASRAKAADYTWDNVAARRRELLLGRLAIAVRSEKGGPACPA